MTAMTDALPISGNPVFVRFRRSRLRWRKALFWYLLTVIVTTFVVTLTYTIRVNSGVDPASAARSLWIPLLIIQGVILMIKGTGAVSAGLIQDKLDGTLDYQRLTPLSPLASLLGYLFGLPVLEYAMAALTLPHLAFIVVVGDVPLTALASVYLAFFTCVVLYHMTGIAIGIVMRRWIIGYLFSIFLVVTVNVILPTFVSQLGLKFFQFLSVWPVIGQKVLPLVVSPAALESAMQNPWFATAGNVPFYDLELSAFVFTLMMQGALILTFSMMALRRWRSEAMHSLSKPYALGFLIAFLTVLTGNVWPAITGQYLPFAIFGRTEIDELAEVIALAFPMVYAIVTWLLCLLLFAIVVPDHHAALRGLRRARRQGRRAEPPWSDDSTSFGFMSLFVAAVLAVLFVLYRSIAAAGFLEFLGDPPPVLWRLPAALALVLVHSVVLIQALERKPAVLVVLLGWCLPILAAIVLASSTRDATTIHTVLASFSPIATLLMAGATPVGSLQPVGSSEQVAAVLTGSTSGLVLVALQTIVLAWLWQRRRRRYERLVETGQAPAHETSDADVAATDAALAEPASEPA